jgi:hypothetical protein
MEKLTAKGAGKSLSKGFLRSDLFKREGTQIRGYEQRSLSGGFLGSRTRARLFEKHCRWRTRARVADKALVRRASLKEKRRHQNFGGFCVSLVSAKTNGHKTKRHKLRGKFGTCQTNYYKCLTVLCPMTYEVVGQFYIL